jgi:hypothetical protein
MVQGRQGYLRTDSWVWGVRLTSTPIKNILLYGCTFKEWIPYLVWRLTQRYFKKFPCFTLSAIFIYATEIRTFIFNIHYSLLDTLGPKIYKIFHVMRKKGFWLIMMWVMHCLLHLIICKLTTSYSILEGSNRWNLEGQVYPVMYQYTPWQPSSPLCANSWPQFIL